MIGAIVITERKHESATGLALLLYVIGVLCLDLQLNVADLNLGNLAMVGFSIASIAVVAYSNKQSFPFLRRPIGQDYIYLLYLLLCAMSVAWSSARMVTFVQTSFLLILFLGCQYSGAVRVQFGAMLIVRCAAVIGLLSLLLVVIAPTQAFQPLSSTGLPELRGIFRHQLRLGAFQSAALAVAVIAYRNGEWRAVVHPNFFVATTIIAVIAVTAAAALARSYSAYAMLALILSIGISKPGQLRVITFFCLFTICALILMYSDTIISWVAESGGDVTLTGRTRVWEVTLAASEASWKLGRGYATFDTATYDHLWRQYRPPHPHNSFLAALFETGVGGLALTVALIIVQLVTVLRSGTQKGKFSYALFFVIFSFLGSLTGVNYAGKPSILFSLAMLFVTLEMRGGRIRSEFPVVTGRGVRRRTGTGY